MTVQELVARFPEIPKDLHEQPILSRFAEVFGELLRGARNPGACAAQHDAANHYYLKLIGPVAIYDYGLSTRERVLAELRELLDRHAGAGGEILQLRNLAVGGHGRTSSWCRS